ncbi:transcriptional regulator [Sphaerisporangium melleum]|uniref:Transcriptional regulator n=2 Tax=Sphaerisporangium melleum TaxID=321316 RepID=A0A917QVG9_9ACTN|nr:transcriptional regulator [Sphaerisporangium melleum]GII70330.1 transcriptional regulator [Sphaerisporangium melleum]
MTEPAHDAEAVPAPPWERARRRAAPVRVPLTLDRIVDAAYTVLDREGYDRLSMRQVAAELGVAVSALYAHVTSKDELLDRMYARLFDGHGLPDPDPERWREQIKQYARDGRARLRAHRDMARISMARVPMTPELLPHIEQLLAVFRAAGLPDRVAAAAGDMLSTYLDGFAYEESMWEERRREAEVASWPELRAGMVEYFQSLPPDRFPHLRDLAAMMIAENNDSRFELGLDIILRGLASYIPPGHGTGEPGPAERGGDDPGQATG